MSGGTGRSPRLAVRLRATDLDVIRRAAAADGRNLTAWVRRAVVRAAERSLAKSKQVRASDA